MRFTSENNLKAVNAWPTPLFSM